MKIHYYLLILLFLAIICGCCDNVNSSQENVHYITFEMTKSGHILLNVIINDSINGKFMLDNGSDCCTFDSTFFYDNFDKTKFKIWKQHPSLWFENAEGSMNISTEHHSFSIKKEFSIENFKNKISGIIGSEMFKNKIAIINFENNKIAFVDNCSVPDGYHTIKLLSPFIDSFPYLNHMKYIHVSGFESNKGKDICSDFLFDLGASSGLSAKHSFFKTIKHDISHVDTGRSKTINTKYPTMNHIYYFDSLFLDTLIPIYNVDINVSQKIDPLEALRYGDGLLGMNILSKFNLIYDDTRNLLYIKPNNKYFEK